MIFLKSHNLIYVIDKWYLLRIYTQFDIHKVTVNNRVYKQNNSKIYSFHGIETII